MTRCSKFRIIFAPETIDHVAIIDRKHHALLHQVIHEQLSHQPATATRNRKLLKQPAPFGATWELRCGPQNRYRVFYEVKSAECIVRILAVGIKDRNRLFIDGEELKL